MEIRIKGQQTVSVEEIYVVVICPHCKTRQTLKMKGVTTLKTCRCTKISMKFVIQPYPGGINVSGSWVDNYHNVGNLKIHRAFVEHLEN